MRAFGWMMKRTVTAAVLLALLLLSGCGGEASGRDSWPMAVPGFLMDAGITETGLTELSYAEGFAVHELSEGFRLIDLSETREQWLVVPEGQDVPEGLPQEVRVLRRPLSGIYMAGSAVMSLFDALDAVDAVGYSATRAEDWYVESAADAMRSGRIRFAGKYSEPDYEMLTSGGCPLAVESTMILHTPEVQENLEKLGVPVLVDRSSYETHPLGRTEWIRLYGAMLGKEEEADAFFRSQVEKVDAIKAHMSGEGDRRTVVFFYINAAGKPVVRGSEDYIARMIELGGGEYLFPGNADKARKKTGSVSVTAEEFYAAARDADYMIYNALIDEPLEEIGDLTGKSPLLADFKAVKEGRVFTTDRYLYQATDRSGDFIADVGRMLSDEEEGMVFLRRVLP